MCISHSPSIFSLAPDTIASITTASSSNTAIQVSTWTAQIVGECTIKYDACICRMSDGCTSAGLDSYRGGAKDCKIDLSSGLISYRLTFFTISTISPPLPFPSLVPQTYAIRISEIFLGYDPDKYSALSFLFQFPSFIPPTVPATGLPISQFIQLPNHPFLSLSFDIHFIRFSAVSNFGFYALSGATSTRFTFEQKPFRARRLPLNPPNLKSANSLLPPRKRHYLTVYFSIHITLHNYHFSLLFSSLHLCRFIQNAREGILNLPPCT